MYTIGLSNNLPLEGFEEYLRDFNIIMPKERLAGFSKEEVDEILPQCDAFVTMLDFPFRRRELEIARNLKVLGNLGSGFDNVDVKTASERGVVVLNTPASVVAPTSEMTMTLILSICRSVCWYDRTFRADRTCHKNLLLERDMCLEGKKLGIIGFGRIGKGVARKAKAFGMDIIYYDRFRSPEEVEKEMGAKYMESAEDVLREADVVTIHMAYTPESRHFINKDTLALMKPTAYLVNASRGPIVCEMDLYECLKNHGIRGAALDVHESEPHVSAEIASLENVVITPHICTNISEIRLNMFGELVRGIHDVLISRTRPVNIVNREIWKDL